VTPAPGWFNSDNRQPRDYATGEVRPLVPNHSCKKCKNAEE